MPTPLSVARRILASPFVWCVFWLALLDAAVGLGLRALAVKHPDAALVRYFEYGRSIEGKLDILMALPPDDPRARVLEAGWIDAQQWQRLPVAPAPGADLLVAVYGQSFANHASQAAASLDGRLTLRQIAGPAAPLDHSFAAMGLDQGLRHADVVVVGILASAVPHIGTMSGIDWTFENPAPFTFAHYTVEHGRLVGEAPGVDTVAAFRSAFTGRTADWLRFKQQLARHDRGYDRLTFDRTWLDGSNLVKLMRRGWIAHSAGYGDGVYSSRTGFLPDAEPVRTMRAILPEMARLARSHGERLIVLLEHDQGYADHLYQALKDTLAAEEIEFISTHTLFSAADPQNFVADGHYTDAANRKLGAALQSLIRHPPPAASSATTGGAAGTRK